MRDVTKEKSLEEERDEFISVVSHELRTPVAIAEGNISNAIYMSAKHHDPKVVKNSLNQAHDQVVYLANMINDLATLSRAERTDVPLEISTVDIKALAESIARDYQSEASAKNLKLTISIAEETKAIQSAQL
jgi:two-component system sensor histidine kinase ResE